MQVSLSIKRAQSAGIRLAGLRKPQVIAIADAEIDAGMIRPGAFLPVACCRTTIDSAIAGTETSWCARRVSKCSPLASRRLVKQGQICASCLREHLADSYGSVPKGKEAISEVTTAPWSSCTGRSPGSDHSRGVTLPASGGACDATHRIVASWPAGYQGQVTVRVGRIPINGWTVSWTLPAGQSVTRIWNGMLTTSGSAVWVRNAPYNGSLPAACRTTFGFAIRGEPSELALTCTSS